MKITEPAEEVIARIGAVLPVTIIRAVITSVQGRTTTLLMAKVVTAIRVLITITKEAEAIMAIKPTVI
jgi:hypothetical protein